jgi:hypothetical protein
MSMICFLCAVQAGGQKRTCNCQLIQAADGRPKTIRVAWRSEWVLRLSHIICIHACSELISRSSMTSPMANTGALQRTTSLTSDTAFVTPQQQSATHHTTTASSTSSASNSNTDDMHTRLHALQHMEQLQHERLICEWHRLLSPDL